MDNIKVFKVVFRGVILPGFEKEQVIENVHQITRIPKETITRKFFSGKTVVIRRADTQEYASRLQKTFSQAGIETYIEELVESVEEYESQPEYSSESETKKVSVSETKESITQITPKSTEKNLISKNTAAISTLAIIIVISIIYFLFLDGNDSIKEVVQTDSKKTPQINQTQQKLISSPGTQPSTDLTGDSSSIISFDSLVTLIHVTDNFEKDRLKEFLPLLNIEDGLSKLFKTLIDQNNYITQFSPAILFKTKSNSGILLPVNHQIDRQYLEQIKEKLDKFKSKKNELNLCQIESPFSLLSFESAILISNLSPNIARSVKKDVFEAISKISKRFERTKMPESLKFKLYYGLPDSRHSLNKKNQLFIGSTGDQIWLESDSAVAQANTNLFKQLKLKPRTIQKINLEDIKSLTTLVQMISSQYQSDNLFDGDKLTSVDFEQEYITEITPSSIATQFKAYDNKLDPELKVQWQNGPFAITTNNIQFSDKLIIQLLAKGQNIPNYMEYSHQASITPYAVYDDKKTNLMHKACNNNMTQNSFFKNLDGEQEAYIGDDFISFYTINSKSNVPVEPGVQLNDIESIVGKIEINQPEQIKHYSLEHTINHHHKHFEHFSLLIQMIDNSSIRSQVIGDSDYFLTIRAFNKSGEVLDTEGFYSFKQDNKIHLFQQKYSNTIENIKVFFTEKNNLLTYEFSIKPEINSTSDALTDINREDSDPVVFNNTNLSLRPINETIKKDYPEWLGKKIKEKTLFPFHISLFTPNSLNEEQQENSKEIKDALLNIKTSQTPLISQNLTSVKLTLNDDKEILFNEYVTFVEKTVTPQEPIGDNAENIELNSYLNTNAAFQYQQNNLEHINGKITLNLPTALKHHTTPYVSPGQSIKLDGILIKPIEIDRQQIKFEISGKINDLVQLRLYNKEKELISEPLEFKQLKSDLAHLSLIYTDQIDLIKLILAKVTVQKEYPIVFSK